MTITVHQPPDIAAVLALSDERDQWERVCLVRERQAYDRGFADGRACACVALAEIEERYQAIAHWREWAAWLRTVAQDPSVRIERALREIARDQEFMRAARAKQPHERTHRETCAVLGLRLADPGDAV